jgi:membrane-associated protein
MESIKELLHYLNPEVIINLAGEYAIFILIFIIFAETGLLFGFFLPGDSLLFTAGMFVASGHISTGIVEMILLLIVAAIVGDQVGYLTGRWLGNGIYKLKDNFIFKQKYILHTKAFYDRHGGKTIIIGRFVPIVRTFAPILAGVVQLEYKKFIPYNIIGGVVWITSMSLLGYFLGKIPLIKDNVGKVAILIILISVIPIITTFIQEKRRAKAVE